MKVAIVLGLLKLGFGGDQRIAPLIGLAPHTVARGRRELIGNFKNPGARWVRDPILVKDHNFRSEAKALVTRYGVYVTQANRGSVFLGTSDDTPASAVVDISQW